MKKQQESRETGSRRLGRREFLGTGASSALALGAATRPPPPASAGNCPLPDFPSEIPLRQQYYRNWSLNLNVPSVWWASPQSSEDVVLLANWARTHDYALRPVGQSHNWSPIVITNRPAPCKVLLVDTEGLKGEPEFHPGPFPSATFGVGTTVEEATAFLETLDNEGLGAAPGFTFQNMTAPGKVTLGGVLAVGAHGTGVPWRVAEPDLNGCLSNLILSFEAVVTDPVSESEAYVLKHFERNHPDASAFLVHLGRAFLTRVTLRVVPNFYLQVDNWYPSAQTLFESPSNAPSQESIASLLDDFGRVEVTWFPYTDNPWVKTWKLQPQRIEPQVPGPYNYPWQTISLPLNNLIKFLLFLVPSLTPLFGRLGLVLSQRNAPQGALLNGKSRDVLLYVERDTLRVGAFSYALQVRRDQVQDASRALFLKYTEMLESYRARGAYPVNGPLEFRFSTMDHQTDLGVAGADPPALSSCRSVSPNDPELDTVIWFSILTIPGTRDSNEFFAELETWMLERWGQHGNNVIRPEWTKGWAYGRRSGPWTHRGILKRTIPGQFNQPDNKPVFTWTRQTLQAYDKHHLFTNRFLDGLLPG